MTDYLQDANIFIQARNLHYGFDFRPAFRDRLAASNEAGISPVIALIENTNPSLGHRHGEH